MGKVRKEAIIADGVPAPKYWCSPAVRFGDFVFVSGMMATDFQHGLAPEVRIPYYGENLKEQTKYILENLQQVLQSGGTSLDNVMKMEHFFTTRLNEPYLAARKNLIKGHMPVSFASEVGSLLVPGALLQVDATAIIPGIARAEAIHTDKIPLPMADYSQAIRWGDWVFVAGDLATDFKTGVAPEARLNEQMWYGNRIKVQTRYTLEKLRIVLEDAGSSLDNIVKVQVLLKDVRDISGMDDVWREYFPIDPPARTIIPVNGLAVNGAVIEIYPIAVTRDGRLKKDNLRGNDIPASLFYEPPATRVGNLLFLSTQLAADANGLAPEVRIDPNFPYFGQSVKKQMKYMLKNVRSICEAAGTSLDYILKVQAFYTDFSEFDASMEVWQEYLSTNPPAFTAVEVREPLPVPGSSVLLDVIAGIPS